MGHLRGAVSVPLKKLQAPDGRLGQPEQLAAAFGEAGLGDDVTPVLYDHRDGRKRRHGGLGPGIPGPRRRSPDGPAPGGLEGTGPGGPVPARPNRAEDTLRWASNPSVRATIDDVSSPGAARLLDARSPEEFRGQDGNGPSPRAHSRCRESSPRRIGRRRREDCSLSQTCCASGWRPLASLPATRWWPTAAAESGPHWPTCPCSGQGTTCASTTAPTQNGWTAGNAWKSSFPV